MKRIYLLLFVLLAFAGKSFGQADVQLTKTMSDTVKYANPAKTGYIIRYTFKNLGPNALDTSCRLVLHRFYDATGTNVTLSFSNVAANWPGGFSKDSTLIWSDTIGFTAVLSPNPRSLCDSVWAIKGTAVQADPSLANNKTCKTVYSVADPLSVLTVDNGTNELSVYPNPAANTVNLKYDFAGTAKADVIVTDMLGNVVYKKNWGNTLTGEQQLKIDLANFSNGIYILQLNVNDAKKVTKFTVQQ